MEGPEGYGAESLLRHPRDKWVGEVSLDLVLLGEGGMRSGDGLADLLEQSEVAEDRAQP